MEEEESIIDLGPLRRGTPNRRHCHATPAPLNLEEDPRRVSPLVDGLASPARWRLVVKGRWRKAGKIHNREAYAALLGLRHLVEAGIRGYTVLSLGDNMAEVLAADKGRARYYALLAFTRKAAAFAVAGGLGWRRRKYIESARNPSDHDSRVFIVDYEVASPPGLGGFLHAVLRHVLHHPGLLANLRRLSFSLAATSSPYSRDCSCIFKYANLCFFWRISVLQTRDAGAAQAQWQVGLGSCRYRL